MILFNNSTPEKTLADIKNAGKVRWYLWEVVNYIDIVIEKKTGRKHHAVVTSLIRKDGSSHESGDAVDLRARHIKYRRDRLEIERIVRERYPVPPGMRERIKYWDEENSPVNKYAPHFHVDVSVPGGIGGISFPVSSMADNHAIDRSGSIL